MRKSITMRAGAIGTAFALAGGLAVIASGTTGAYFSDTKTGVIKGTTGSIKITTTGGAVGADDGLNFAFVNLMPGEAQTATVNFTNTGKKAQDVYLTFPNRPALHALNNAGTFAEVHVAGGKGGNIAPLFDSTNLNDGRRFSETGNSCGPFDPTGCWPLPDKLLVARDVAPSGTGSVSFSFNYPTKMTGGQDGVFNAYPVTEAFGADAAGTAGDGLPVNVVAVQVNKTP